MVRQDFSDAREYEMALHDAAAEDYEKGVSEWIVEHKCFISARWGRKFHGLFLDYGCGTGLVTRYLISLRREVVGVDTSRNMCKIVKKLWGVQVVVGDCLNLPFKDKAFDVICVSGVLHHFPHQLERAFSEIGRCVKKAVCIIEPSATPPPLILRFILFLYKGYKWILFRLYKRVCGKYTYSVFERPLIPAKLTELCEKEGFVVSEIRFFNHIPLITFLPETFRKHLVQSMLSPVRGTDVEIIATRH
jgi:SAM-dependent methyltransferase